MKERRFRRRGLILSLLVGASVLTVVVIGLLARSADGGGLVHPTPVSPAPSATVSSSPAAVAGESVDPGVVKRGWVPEPITQDPDAYVRAAFEAAATFDTRHSTREEWLNWLGTWFTPSPHYGDQQDALDQMAGYKAELEQSVVLPQSQWDDLANGDGRVSARVDGSIDYIDQSDAEQKGVRTATANVVMTFTQAGDGANGDASHDQTVRVSVQVVCGGASIPTPNSAQRAGDCKVVRFFDTAVG
jgi:hypothetical protein